MYHHLCNSGQFVRMGMHTGAVTGKGEAEKMLYEGKFMKKKLILLVGILCCSFILAGCKKNNVQELVLNKYELWMNMNMDIWIIGPSVEYENSFNFLQNDNFCYYEVVDNRLNSISDIKEEVEKVCTVSGAEKMFYHYYLEQEKVYYEEDGVLYRKMVEIPANYGGEFTSFEVVEKRKDFIHAKINFFDKETDNSYMIEITLVKQNQKWLIESLEQIYIDN